MFTQVLSLVLVLFAGGKKDLCPYCKNDPKILAKSGLVGHGPFEYAARTTTDVEKHLAYVKKIYWLESEHFKFGLTLPKYKIPDKERKFIRAELEQLAKVLPKVKVRTGSLDPWLRLHLYVWRAEKYYDLFLDIVQKKEKDFNGWASGRYMGEGSYLGQKGKFEVLLFSNKAPYLDFLRQFTGAPHDKPQRHNFTKTDSLFFGCHIQDDMLNRDTNLYSALIHNLGHNFMDGYRHYSYDMPVWITEGFAHYYEKMVDDNYVSYCFVENYKPYKRQGGGWAVEFRKRVESGKAPDLPGLVRKLSYSDLEQLDHIAVWSLVDFFSNLDKKRWAQFLDEMNGRVSNEGRVMSGGLRDVQREAIKKIYGFSYPKLEEAWHNYVKSTYPMK